MDPIANIREQRELAADILNGWWPAYIVGGDQTIGTVDAEHIRRLAELVVALDEWRTSGGFDPYPTAVAPVYRYLDLSTAHLTEAEMDAVNARLAAIDDETPRVIVHEYGAWVNVTTDEAVDEQAEAALAAAYPNLAACIKHARELGCWWINFDQDAGADGALPTYEW